MKKLDYNPLQKRRASTLMALGTSEFDAAKKLIEAELYREAVVHFYFTAFYVSQALLCQVLNSNPSHKAVDSLLHKTYGRATWFPKRYVRLHTSLHNQRIEFDYHTTHTPDPDVLKQQLRLLAAFVRFALSTVPRVEVIDLLRSTFEDNPGHIKDFSFDVYCPKTYAHHTRLTIWQPPFYLDIFGVKQLASAVSRLLRHLRVKKVGDYVVGLNSRVNQYQDDHLIMLDIDTLNPAVEAALKKNMGGILLKSGRGFHFIGRKVVAGSKNWRRELKALLKNKTLKMHLDKDHIEISIKRGYSTLRVTASPIKPIVPYFYKEI